MTSPDKREPRRMMFKGIRNTAIGVLQLILAPIDHPLLFYIVAAICFLMAMGWFYRAMKAENLNA